MRRPGLAEALSAAMLLTVLIGCGSPEPETVDPVSSAAAQEAASMWTEEQKAAWRGAAAQTGLSDGSAPAARTAPPAPQAPPAAGSPMAGGNAGGSGASMGMGVPGSIPAPGARGAQGTAPPVGAGSMSSQAPAGPGYIDNPDDSKD